MAKSSAAPILVHKFLQGVKYPASKNDLIKRAKQNKASVNVISMLEELDRDQFISPADVSRDLGDEEYL